MEREGPLCQKIVDILLADGNGIPRYFKDLGRMCGFLRILWTKP